MLASFEFCFRVKHCCLWPAACPQWIFNPLLEPSKPMAIFPQLICALDGVPIPFVLNLLPVSFGWSLQYCETERKIFFHSTLHYFINLHYDIPTIHCLMFLLIFVSHNSLSLGGNWELGHPDFPIPCRSKGLSARLLLGDLQNGSSDKHGGIR